MGRPLLQQPAQDAAGCLERGSVDESRRETAVLDGCDFLAGGRGSDRQNCLTLSQGIPARTGHPRSL
jgi:hypothetical protein